MSNIDVQVDAQDRDNICLALENFIQANPCIHTWNLPMATILFGEKQTENTRLRETLRRAIKDVVQIGSVVADLDNSVFHTTLFHQESDDPRDKEILEARKTLGYYVPTFSDMYGFLNMSDKERAQIDQNIMDRLLERAALKGKD